jgi:uncharacterized membrane protein YdjX (TVP38/TMEM64 family)
MTTFDNPEDAPARRSEARPVVVLAIALVAIFVFWRFGPLSDLRDPHRLASLATSIREHPNATPMVLGVYLAAALLFFPMTWLMAATALVFQPMRALALSMAGGLIAAVVTYGIGRVVGRYRADWLDAPRVARVREKMRRRGVLAMTGLRLMPVGNFTLFNIVAGAVPIRFRDYLIGNVLGLLPTLLALTLLADRLRALGWGTP